MIQPRLKRICYTATAFLLSSMWLLLRPATSIGSTDVLLHAVLSIVLAALLLLKSPYLEKRVIRQRLPMACAFAGLLLFALGNIFSVNQIQWLGIVTMSFACLTAGIHNRSTADIAKVAFLLYWANPLPSGIFLPLQLFMQKMSVGGAELLLQSINVRIWADGLILKTGLQSYEIPAWCSGMRTATAVLILSFGIGLHKRLPPVKLLLFTALALIQALLLNIIRISLVVFLAPSSDDPSGFQLLHDSSGVVLIAAIFLIAAELQIWSRRTTVRADGDAEQQRFFRLAFSGFPEFVNIMREQRTRVLIVFIIAAMIGTFAFRTRAYHRSEMIKSVAESLRNNGKMDSALRAAEEARKLQPDDEDWNMTRIRMLLIAGKYDHTLSELERYYSDNFTITAGGWDSTTIEVAILRSYSLIGLKQYDQATSIIEALPAYAKRNNPLVAMVMAEIGYFLDDIDQVTDNIATAAAWEPNARRIRSLYPYLRKNRRWRAISESDTFSAKHARPAEAFCAMEAAMNLDDTPRLAFQIDAALALWPNEYRILEPLYFMVLRRSASQWEGRFAEHFIRCLPLQKNPDAIFTMIKKAFEITRADLAWAAFTRLRSEFPDHPGVEMAPGYYGERWFYLNRDTAGTKGSALTSHTDIRPFILIAMSTPGMDYLTTSIPFKDQILELHKTQQRKLNIEAARKAFHSSEREHSTSLKFEYARMLEMTGNKLELSAYINQLIRTEPSKEKVISFISEINERKGDWLQVYENLKDYAISDRASLATALRLCRAQINLKMYLGAQNTAQTTAYSFPESSLAAGMLAETELILDRPEAALMALRRPRAWSDPALRMPEIRALFKSGRTQAGMEFCKRNLMPVPDEFAAARDVAIVAPAEYALMWHKLSLPSMSDFKSYSSRMMMDVDTASPFFKDLYQAWLDAFKAKGSHRTTDPNRWISIGRTDSERATALNLLTIMLCRFSKYEEALNVAGKAVRFLPDSPLLWHPLIGLSKSNPAAIASAAEQCPDDADIWLAQLVKASDPTETLAKEARSRVEPLIDAALTSRRISPLGLTRGSAYLLRIGLNEEAQRLASAASVKDPGFLPAQLAALRCAMQQNDRELALGATRRAIHASRYPDLDLYRKYVELHSDQPNADDTDLLNALQAAAEERARQPTLAAHAGLHAFPA